MTPLFLAFYENQIKPISKLIIILIPSDYLLSTSSRPFLDYCVLFNFSDVFHDSKNRNNWIVFINLSVNYCVS